jgi:ABC-type sugar transport system substrate-binding protein
MRTSMTTIAAISIILAGTLAGCSSSSPSSTESAADEVTLGVVLSRSSDPYFQTMSDAIQAAADEAGVKIMERSVADGVDSNEYNQNVDSLVTLGVDGILAAPIGAANQQALQRAVDAGIPVIELDSPIVDWTGQSGAIATDNVDAGRIAMGLLLDGLEAADKVAKVIIVNTNLGFKSVDDRTDGAEEVAQQRGADLVQIVDGGTSQAEAQSNVETILRGNPDITGIMSTVSVFGLGSADALRTSGAAPGLVLITGVDGVDAELEAIEAGEYYGVAAQQPAEMGKLGVEQMLALLGGEDIDADTLVPAVPVTAESLDEFRGQ